MAVALMFVSQSPKPAVGPAAAALTLPRLRAASSPAPAEGCAEPRTRRCTASRPPLLSRRFLPPLPLSTSAHGLLRGRKMDYSDPPGLLRRRAVPRTGKHSTPLGLVLRARAPFCTAARRRLPCPPALFGHLSLGAPYSCYYLHNYGCCYCYCNFRCYYQ